MPLDKSKIEEIIHADCPACNTPTAFLYLGIQEGQGKYPDYVLYTCFSCQTARAENSLR